MPAPTPEAALVYDLFEKALAAVNGESCVADFLKSRPVRQPVAVVAIGKAASAMTLGACSQLGQQLDKALVITKSGHMDDQLLADPRIECLESAHPVPDQRSLHAGHRLCSYLSALPEQCGLLFLISGGSSSLVEVLAEGVSLDMLVRANQWLLASGLSIPEINGIRTTLSQIKGGGLLAHTAARPTTVLLISDVPGNDAAAIGSGLLIAGKHERSQTKLPYWFPVTRHIKPCSPEDSDTVHHHIIATNLQALKAAASRGNALGYHTTLIEQQLTGDALQAGRDLAEYLERAPQGLYLWGGETTVVLPEQPPEGGRNLHLALSAANNLSTAGIVMLVAGTDGSDGTSDYAGAIIDSSTRTRGYSLGLDPGKSLQQADAATYLAACDDTFITGPTGTNVMDVVIAFKGDCHNSNTNLEG